MENPLLEVGQGRGQDNESKSGRREALLKFCAIAGLGAPALMWILALAGVKADDFPTDKFATAMVTLSIYSPLLAFVNNAGESRALKQQLSQFAWVWFFSNTGYQLFWELPWFLLKGHLMTAGVDNLEDEPGYWPWWAYGRADTRYLQHNDLTLAISGMDAAISLVEICVCFLYMKNYQVISTWLALALSACLAWGQFYFYLGEIYNNFENIHDGWFGMYVKYGVMNIPWCLFCFPQTAGFMWNLAVIYKQRGIEEYLKSGASPDSPQTQSFSDATNLYLVVDEKGQQQCHETTPSWLRNISIFMFFWPWAFLILDSSIWAANHY